MLARVRSQRLLAQDTFNKHCQTLLLQDALDYVLTDMPVLPGTLEHTKTQPSSP
jgi:hypothetical protein